VFGDVHAPYHDRSAWEIMLQIGEDLKPDVLVENGDFADWRTIGKYPARPNPEKELINEWRHEVAIQRTLYKELVKRVKAKKYKKNDGNHEWRVARVLMHAGPVVCQLLGIPEIRGSFSSEKILGTDALGFKYSGPYPNGCWLFDTRPERNVWVEHGHLLSQKAGNTANRIMEKRFASTINGHSHRLGAVWRKVVGDRRVFAVEAGTLAIFGEPGAGDDIYDSVPFNVADYADHQQGFLVIYRDGNQIFPVPVPIHKGKAVFNGRLYRA